MNKLWILALISLIQISSLQFNNISAQEVWSLEKCVKYAQDNNLTCQQSKIGIDQAEINYKSNKAQRYPTLNYSSSGGYQWGRTIDYGTNTFVNQSTNFNSHSLQTGMTLYNGGNINNSIKKAGLDLMASSKDAQQTAENIALTVSSQYLSILLSMEAVEMAKKRIEISKKQLDQTDKLINAGNLPKNERLNILATVARDEENQLTQENNLALAYFDLKSLLNLDASTDMQIQKPNTTQLLIDNQLLTDIGKLYQESSQRNPGIAASELRMNSSEVEKKIAGASGLPSLSLFGSVQSNYSSSLRDVLHPDFTNAKEVLSPAQKVNFNGTDVFISTYTYNGIVYPTKSIGDQLSDNLGQSLGLSLRVPIYNGSITRYNKQRAELAIKTAQLNNTQLKQQLKNDIYRAVTDYKSARQRVEVANREYEAAEGSFVNVQKKYDVGAANSLELVTAKSNADSSEDNLLTARYSLLFRTKVLEFYLGQPIQLN